MYRDNELVKHLKKEEDTIRSKLHDINVESYKPTLEDIARSGGVEIKEESN